MLVNPVICKAKVKTSTKAEFSWKKVKGAQRYQIYFAPCGKTKAPVIKTTKKLSYIKKGLKKGVCYRFKVTAQRKIGGKWKTISTGYLAHFTSGNLNTTKKFTNPKSISVAKKSVTIKKGKTSTIKATIKLVKPNKLLLREGHAPKFRYLSYNTDIATVDSKGKITAKKKGTCTVYVIGVNGISKGIKVTVK